MQKFNFARDSVGRGCIDLISEPISSFYCPMASLQLSRPVQMPEKSFQMISGEYNQHFYF